MGFDASLFRPLHANDLRRGRACCATGRVGDPALVLVVAPVDAEVVAGLVEVVGDGVEGGAGAGSAEGDVGRFSAAAGGEDVGAVVGGALGSVDGEGVSVVEVVGVDRFAGQDDRSSFGGDGSELGAGEVDVGNGEAFAGDEALVEVGGEEHEVVPGRVAAPSGGGQLRSLWDALVPELVPVEVPGEAVEVPDVVPAPGQQGRVVSCIDICGPRFD